MTPCTQQYPDIFSRYLFHGTVKNNKEQMKKKTRYININTFLTVNCSQVYTEAGKISTCF